MLRVEHLSKRFGGVVALDDVTFDVARGQLVGFLGPNGAGKTTAMRAILRVIALDEGAVTWNGAPIDDQMRRRIGYMPAERGLYPRMRVSEHVTYIARLAGMDTAAAEAASEAWLERLGLADRADDEVQTLSTGNMQRVQLALALVHDPELLVLDEPFSGLDPVAVAMMREIIDQRVASGAAVLFSSHQLDLVQDISQDVVIINRGRIVLEGQVDELRAAAPQRYVDITCRHGGDWWRPLGLEPVTASEGRFRFELGSDADPRALYEAAAAAGEVQAFSYSPPDLSEIFQQAVSP